MSQAREVPVSAETLARTAAQEAVNPTPFPQLDTEARYMKDIKTNDFYAYMTLEVFDTLPNEPGEAVGYRWKSESTANQGLWFLLWIPSEGRFCFREIVIVPEALA